MKQKIKLTVAALLLTLNLQPTSLLAQSTAFTYQGRLNNGTAPASGIYDLRFGLFDAVANGTENIATTNAGVTVTNGLFITAIDFGDVPKSFAPVWLEIAVRTNGGTGGFAILSPRQQIMPVPFSFYALTASNLSGVLPAAQLAGTAGAATNFTGALGGDVNGPQDATVVASVGGQTAASIASGTLAVNAATDAATPGTLVKRDATGSFQAQDLTLNGNLNLPTTTASAGMITLGGTPFIQAYGYDNIFAGQNAGNLTMSGFNNTAIGAVSFNNNSSGNGNTAIGCYALFANSSGDHNTAMGMAALYQNTSGFANTANGFSALHYNTSGCNNTAMGYEALLFNHTGAYNTAGGVSALVNNSDGSDNTANGFETLVANVSGSDNTADGYQALYFNASGSGNIALGCQAGYNLTTGSNNIDIGNLGVAGEGGVIRLGTPGNQLVTYIAGTINGDGGGLTDLNMGNINGTLSLSQLPSVVLTNNESGVTIAGTFSGNGTAVTNVNLANVNSQGVISWPQNYYLAASPSVGGGPIAFVAADFNGDGKMDLACANWDDNTVTVLTNNGSGGFVIASTVAVGVRPASIVVTSIQNGGTPDLVCANNESSTLTVLTNDGSGRFAVAATIPAALPVSLVAGVFSGNDLAYVNAGSLIVLTNISGNNFAVAFTMDITNHPNVVIRANLTHHNNNGFDLVTANIDNTLTVFTNTGNGLALSATLPVGHAPRSIVSVDVNGDGWDDLICANSGTNTLTVYTNNGSGGFALAATLTVGQYPVSVITQYGSQPDLVCANLGDNTLTILSNDGGGHFTTANTLVVGTSPGSVVSADVNGDGFADLICANGSDNDLSVLLYNPAGVRLAGWFDGNGGSLTNLNTANLVGTLALAQLPSGVVTNHATGVTLNGTFSGDGGGLTNLNYSNIANPPVIPVIANLASTNDARALRLTNSANQLAGIFTGNGANLTNLQAGAITGGLTTNIVIGSSTFFITNGLIMKIQ